MSLELTVILIMFTILLFLATGMELAVAFGVIASLGLALLLDHPQVEIAWTAWMTNNSFSLMAMPLFVFMGTMLSITGIIRGLFRTIDKWVGFLPGALASSVIVAGAVFGAMSGSSIAAAATFSTISLPEMERRGYDPRLALGSIAIAGTLSVLIPPSIIMIIYGTWVNVSVAQLFAAGIIPGIILSIMLIITVTLLVLINPALAPKIEPVSWREKIVSIIEVLPWIGLIVVILGVIFAGIMTPTEASALGAFMSVVFALCYRKMTFKVFKDSLFTAVKVTSMIGFVLFTARLIAFLLQDLGALDIISAFILKLPIGKYGIICLIFIMYLILGCFFDAVSMLVLTVPFVYPVLTKLGFNPIWLGVEYVILAEISFCTPPFGLNLFAMHGVAPRYSILTIARGTMPFLIPALIMLMLLLAFPQLALWLPKVLY